MRDTALLEEAAVWETVWENCGNATWQLMPTMKWAFSLNAFNASVPASASKGASNPGTSGRSSGSGAGRRSLLASTLRVLGRGREQETNPGGQPTWGGYQLAPVDDVYAVGFDEPYPIRDRVLFRSTRVVGGVLLHATRKTSSSQCDGPFAKLTFNCAK